MINTKNIFIAFLMIVTLTIVTVALKRNDKLGIVDLNLAINKPVEMFSNLKISSEAQKNLINRYSQLLPKVMEKYGKDNHLTIIASKVIYSGPEVKASLDVTNKVISKTLREMKKNAS